MPDSPIVLAGISLAGALIPAALGAYSWSRRSRPGATTLAIVLFSLSVWAFAHSLGLLASGSAFLETLGYSAFLLLAPLWLIFTIEHTGRGTWLTWGALALTVSATGAETAQQLMYLKRMDCNTAQGHYFTESLTKEAASAFLAWVDVY